VPKRRKNTLDGKVRQCWGAVVHEGASPRRSAMLAGPMGPEQVQMLSRLPPQYAVAAVVG